MIDLFHDNDNDNDDKDLFGQMWHAESFVSAACSTWGLQLHNAFVDVPRACLFINGSAAMLVGEWICMLDVCMASLSKSGGDYVHVAK